MFTRKPNSVPADQALAVPNVPVASPPPAATSNNIQTSAARAVTSKETIAASTSADTAGIVIIGKGTKITGQITDCAKLEIQGTVEGTIVADVLIVREGGVVKGDVRAAHAEIHGLFEGQLAVRDVLDVRGTGHVEGDLSYGRLAVAMGGYISGKVSSEASAAVRNVATTETGLQMITAPQTSNGVANSQAH